MPKIFLSLGSSLGDRTKYLADSIAQIETKIGKIVLKSSIYETKPWGFDDVNLFLNQVIIIESNLLPEDVLEQIHIIEKNLARTRNSAFYTARTIDIDILYYENQIFYSKDLQIPHKFINQRLFVLEPLNEIAPNFVHPLINETSFQMLKKCLKNQSNEKLNKYFCQK